MAHFKCDLCQNTHAADIGGITFSTPAFERPLYVCGWCRDAIQYAIQRERQAYAATQGG